MAPILQIFLRIKLTRVYACHFSLKKLCIFLTGGVYTPYSRCMSTPLQTTLSNDIVNKACDRCY